MENTTDFLVADCPKRSQRFLPRKLASQIILALLVLLGTIPRLWATSFTFTTINFPGAAQTFANGINSSGQIVGDYIDTHGAYHGYLLSGGVFTSINYPFAPGGTFADGINNAGQIVGSGGNASLGYLLSGGVFTPINYPGSPATGAFGINMSSDIVGAYYDASHDEHGFLLSGGTYSPPIDCPGSFPYTVSFDINDSGDIVGVCSTGAGGHGFLLHSSVFTPILPPGALGAEAIGINNSGEITGFYSTPGNPNRAYGFLFSGGQYTTINFPGADNTQIAGINDAGQFVGVYIDSSGVRHGFLATPTPEPGTLSLLALGSAGLALWRRRRENQ